MKEINFKQKLKNFKNLSLSLLIGSILAAGLTFAWNAVWHGTDWAQSGRVMTSREIAENFEYLKQEIDNLKNNASQSDKLGIVKIGFVDATHRLEHNIGKPGTDWSFVRLDSGHFNNSWAVEGFGYITYENGNVVLRFNHVYQLYVGTIDSTERCISNYDITHDLCFKLNSAGEVIIRKPNSYDGGNLMYTIFK